jgi:hypothetical protein
MDYNDLLIQILNMTPEQRSQKVKVADSYGLLKGTSMQKDKRNSLASTLANGTIPAISDAKLHRLLLTDAENRRLCEALDFGIGNSDSRPNSHNHHILLQQLKRSKAT